VWGGVNHDPSNLLFTSSAELQSFNDKTRVANTCAGMKLLPILDIASPRADGGNQGKTSF